MFGNGQYDAEQLRVMRQWGGKVEPPADPFSNLEGGAAWNPVSQRTETTPLPGMPVEATMPEITILDESLKGEGKE